MGRVVLTWGVVMGGRGMAMGCGIKMGGKGMGVVMGGRGIGMGMGVSGMELEGLGNWMSNGEVTGMGRG